MRVALVHDWLTGMRGGERVLERWCALFPGAPIYTLLWNRGAMSPEIESHPIHTSFIQNLPDAARRYRWYLPLFPKAIASFDLSGFDAVVSSSHCVAKGIRVPAGAFHLSYVHTPMRYVWDLELQYFPPGKFPWPLSWYVRRSCARLRDWDVATRSGPHVLLANSDYVARRIARYWDRASCVVHPPVEVARFRPGEGRRDYYLLAGAFAPYKRGELAIEACRALGRRLVVAGGGPEERRLRAHAGPTIEFRGRVSDAELAGLYANARALIFPGEEDFGIVPLEALASGCPVIAYGRGGILETIARGDADAADRLAASGCTRVPGGVLFAEQSLDSLRRAIEAFERESWSPAALARLAMPFATQRFDQGVRAAFDAGFAAWTSGADPEAAVRSALAARAAADDAPRDPAQAVADTATR